MARISTHLHKAKTGHGCTFVVPVKATQRSVYAEGRPVLRRGDPTKPHVIRVGIYCVGHMAKVNRGSSSVFARGIPVARRGDSTDFGRLIQATGTVHAGG